MSNMAFKVTLCVVGIFLLCHGALGVSLRNIGTADEACPCDTCLHSVKRIDAAMSDTTVDAMMVFMTDHACPKLGDHDQCRSMSAILLPAFVKWFKSAATPSHLCSAPTACGVKVTGALGYQRVLQRPVRDGPLCALCSFVVSEMKMALNSSSVQASIMQKALEICSTLPQQVGASCTEFVTTYEPLVTQFIESVDSTQICLMVGACLGNIEAIRPPALPAGLVSALANVDSSLCGGASNDACDVCKMSVIEAHSLVTNPTVQGDLVNYTKALCDLLGGALSASCHDYVDTYSKEVFDLMDKFLNPDQLCTTLGICKPPAMVVIQKKAKRVVSLWSSLLELIFHEEQ